MSFLITSLYHYVAFCCSCAVNLSVFPFPSFPLMISNSFFLILHFYLPFWAFLLKDLFNDQTFLQPRSLFCHFFLGFLWTSPPFPQCKRCWCWASRTSVAQLVSGWQMTVCNASFHFSGKHALIVSLCHFCWCGKVQAITYVGKESEGKCHHRTHYRTNRNTAKARIKANF